MKILSSKKYEKLQQCLVDLQMDINDAHEQMDLYLKQVAYLQDELNYANNKLEQFGIIIEEKNKEIKRLKTLMTKNGVSYKKEAKK
jgi:capsule polysaccharide export protein KpsE/RkpR